MLLGVERGAMESRKAIRRATTTEEVCTLRAALGGPVAMFVLAVTQPATDDVNATSANPRESRLAASTHVFGIGDPPSTSHVSRLSVRIPTHAFERHAIMATGRQIRRWRLDHRNFLECCELETVGACCERKNVCGEDQATTHTEGPASVIRGRAFRYHERCAFRR